MFISNQPSEVLKPILEVPKLSRSGDPERRPGPYSRPFSSSYTGIQWKFQPRTFPPNSTVRNYLSRWSRS